MRLANTRFFFLPWTSAISCSNNINCVANFKFRSCSVARHLAYSTDRTHPDLLIASLRCGRQYNANGATSVSLENKHQFSRGTWIFTKPQLSRACYFFLSNVMFPFFYYVWGLIIYFPFVIDTFDNTRLASRYSVFTARRQIWWRGNQLFSTFKQ